MINPTQPDNNTHSGFVAIIGRPNVGKSTLLNKMISQKVSITSRKPQTTRQRIIGIKTQENTQIIYVDTPGIHQNAHKALNVYMNKEAKRSLREVDVILFVVENTVWTEEDEMVLNLIKKIEKPIILLINKIDKLEEKDWLLPHLELLSQKHNFLSIVPISARKNLNLTRLEKLIIQTMPEGPFYYEKEQVTDKTFKFRAAEIIREKLTRLLGKELPYALTIEIESFKKEEKVYRIQALIWVERKSQRPIILGAEGNRLKEIATRARLDLQGLLGEKVYLRIWVKVKHNWSDDERALKSLGYEDFESD